MRLIDIIAILLSLSALFSWFNQRHLRLPTTIALMLISLLMSLGLLALKPVAPGLEDQMRELSLSIHFDDAVLHGMLGLLLFAGALQVKLEDLAKQRWIIGILASASVIGATILVGLGSWGLFALIGLDVPLIYCLIFGALIAPTDPIAVLGILKGAGAPKSIETKITGESLFNDGIAIVSFLILLGIAASGQAIELREVVGLFVKEVLGALALGALIGWLANQLLRRVEDSKAVVLITLAVAASVFSLADRLHLSAPIAVVVAGLLVGHHARSLAMSSRGRDQLKTFWELVDEILNAVLFVMIGLEVLILNFTGQYLAAGLLAIPLVLLARLISVGLPIGMMRRFRRFSPGVVTLLTWGGLRGGVSVALALSLPAGEVRDTLVAVTYVVVVFSIVVQGLTLGPVVQAISNRAKPDLAEAGSDPSTTKGWSDGSGASQ
ncbi:sodium:proton antiporter [Thioalkalicoccus limnaeus]|uniref:Sodium:proton antiporter n=1 Tax=Thioalkalicoccus limnaeus TaxID=120681 RepID=A0ABV4B8Z6_9GAMM